MLTLAGASWSFDKASAHLKEFCRIEVSDDTIERVCQEEGERARKWMNEAPEPAADFAAAKGRAEFSTDGLKVNTTGGWREMRLSVLARRVPGAPCEPADWAGRVLDQPGVRFAACAIADAGRVGAAWKRLAARMKLADEPAVDLLADGAKWIWEQAARRLPRHNAKWCVDVYHVSEHLHGCGRELLGEGRAARDWADRHLMTALGHNGPALIDAVEAEASAAPRESGRPLEGLLAYLRANRDRMWYRDRLAAGEPIGSGLIEGGCKNILAARLKLNNARWRIRRAERIGTLRCLDASGQWHNFWKTAA